jgi:hypothetical protein
MGDSTGCYAYAVVAVATGYPRSCCASLQAAPATEAQEVTSRHSQVTIVTVSLTPQLIDGQPQRDPGDRQGDSSNADSEPGHDQTAWLAVSSNTFARSTGDLSTRTGDGVGREKVEPACQDLPYDT